VARIKISVDGLPGDVEDLYQFLTSARLAGGIELAPIARNDATLGVIDTIAAVFSSAAALGSLLVAIAPWKASVGATVRFDLGGGKVITIENADPRAVEEIWNLIQEPALPESASTVAREGK
jgi:hypothetical protein